MSTCPICGLEGISSDKSKCPQCDADLTCFRILDSLPDELPKEKEQGRASKLAGTTAVTGILAVALCVQTGFFLFQSRQVDSLLRDQRALLVETLGVMKSIHKDVSRREQERLEQRRETEAGQIRRAAPEQKAAAPTAAAPKEEAEMKAGTAAASQDRFLTFYSGAGDSLWSLAKRYYGSGHLYPVLMEHNPTLAIYSIGSGAPVRILKDARLARDIYDRIVTKQGNRIYWCYTVMEGDTLESVASRFYRTSRVSRSSLHLFPHAELKAGQKLWILLE